MSIFKRLFWNNNKTNLLDSFERARNLKEAHLNCYLKIFKKLHDKEELLLEQQDITKMVGIIGEMVNNNLKEANEANIQAWKDPEYSDENAIEIIKLVLQEIYNKWYVNNYINFFIMYFLEDSYKQKYNNWKNITKVNQYTLAETLIPSIFSNSELILKLCDKDYNEYMKVMTHAVKNNVKAEEIEINDDFETLLISIIFWIKKQTDISEKQMKDFVMKWIDDLIKNLWTNNISSWLENILFHLIKRLWFDWWLNQIPSFNIVALAQAKRDSNDEDYLPTTDINLTKNEKFLYDKEAIYRKLRNEKERTWSYYWITSSIKIAKWLRFRMWHIVMPKQRVERLEDIDIWNIYLTNKRILFKWKKKTFSIDLNKLLSIELSEYWLLLFKNWNENPYIIWMNDEDYFVICELVSDLLNK